MTHPKLKPFQFHGTEFNSIKDGEDRAWGRCIFCQNEDRKFSVNLETGQWDCKQCGKSGNTYTFLSQLLETCLEETDESFYKELAEHRSGIPWTVFRDHGFAYDASSTSVPRWIFPVKNHRGSIINLRTFVYNSHPLATAGLPHAIYRLEHLLASGPIYVCEGEWDALALENLRIRAKQKGSVIAMPGASVFKKEWCDWFQNREVYFLYDNDEPGILNSQKHAEFISARTKDTYVLQWPDGTDPGYDIRDFCIQHHRSPKNAFNDLLRCMYRIGGSAKREDPYVPGVEIPHRETFEEVVEDFRRYYSFDDPWVDALALMLAVVLSIQLPGDPVWLFVVGPPGCGKTLLLNTFQRSPYTIFRSSITPKSLISGFQSSEFEGGDPSLIPMLTGKTLIVKDYTELMTLSRNDQDEIYGILRGAYDGRCEKTFGNGVHRQYEDCHFAMLAGVTDEIHRDNRASLGERFLKFQMIEGLEYDPDDQIRSAINSIGEQMEAEAFLKGVVGVFTDREILPGDIPPTPAWLVDKVVALSQIIAVARSIVSRVEGGDPAYRPTAETGTRLAKQIVKLATCLSLIFKEPGIGPRSYRLAEKVAIDTGRGWTFDVLNALANNHPQYQTREELSEVADVPKSTLNRRLADLRLLRVVESKPRVKSQAGRRDFEYRLTERYQRLWDTAFSPTLNSSPEKETQRAIKKATRKINISKKAAKKKAAHKTSRKKSRVRR